MNSSKISKSSSANLTPNEVA